MDSASITVRRLDFGFPEELDPVILEGQPEESYVIVGLSLLLPYLEPYLIRTMNAARKEVTDPELRAQLDQFNGQEGQHYRQHMRFNETLRLQGVPGLAELEAELDADYRRFTATRPLRWNLAYAEGFEAYTSAAARFALESGQVARMQPWARDLFEWHLIEELEHRTVAFDVCEHVAPGYLHRLWVGWFAQRHLNRFVFRASLLLGAHERATHGDRFGSTWQSWRRIGALVLRMTRGFTPKVLSSYLPWYTPHRIPLSPAVRERLAHYGARALP